MSYEIVKSINHIKKGNQIFITSASSNVTPKYYSRWEFIPNNEKNQNIIDDKELYLFHGIIGGSYKLSGSVNENWRYAENKFYEYCRENNINTFDLWNLPYENGENIKVLKPYYDIFKKFLEEKKEGKYYLSSSLGYIVKVNQNSFKYLLYCDDYTKYCKNYKKIYNDYCNLSEKTRENYNIEIKEYVLENNKDNNIENNDMELII